MTQYASITTRSAWLGKEFGEEYARKIFGDDVVDALPRYVRGKNAGKFKAEIEWAKVERGGWIRTGAATANGDATGRVENRAGSTIAWRLIQREWGTGHVAEEFARKVDRIDDGQYFDRD